MNTLCKKQGITLIYVIAVDTSDYSRFQSVFNTVNESRGYTPWEVGYQRDATNEEYREIYRQMFEGGTQRETVTRIFRLKGREPHTTALLPLTGSYGAEDDMNAYGQCKGARLKQQGTLWHIE